MEHAETVQILAFGAHPDDVELGCSGTLYKLHRIGYTTAIVDLTEGEMGSRGTVADRRREAEEAARILEVAHRRNLQIPDTHIEINLTNRQKVIEVVRALRPRLVFAPYPGDRHPDHMHASQLITEACYYSGLKKILPELPPHRPERIVYYMCHYPFTPSFVVDISEEFERKMKAIQAYRSQFFNPDWPETHTFISSKEFLESVEIRARHYGWMSGVRYAEPFWTQKPLVLNDLLAVIEQ